MWPRGHDMPDDMRDDIVQGQVILTDGHSCGPLF